MNGDMWSVVALAIFVAWMLGSSAIDAYERVNASPKPDCECDCDGEDERIATLEATVRDLTKRLDGMTGAGR